MRSFLAGSGLEEEDAPAELEYGANSERKLLIVRCWFVGLTVISKVTILNTYLEQVFLLVVTSHLKI